MERYEEDDFMSEDRVVLRTSGGDAVVLPASARRLSGDRLDLFQMLSQRGIQIASLEEDLRAELVPLARASGLSWSLIGAALGLTGEGARHRYSEDG